MPTRQFSDDRGEFETDPRWTAIDEYTASHLHPPSRPNHAAITHAVKNSAAKGLADIAAPSNIGKFLALQCQMLHAKHAIEFGTLGGCTAIWLTTMNPHLKVTTLEYEAPTAKVARENIANAGVSDRVDLILGPAVDALPKLEQEIQSGQREKLDFTFIDADKMNNWTYFDWAVGMSRPGACIVVDNVVSKGNLADAKAAETNHMAKGARICVENVGKDERVEAMVMQIVGEKDYDGFLMAVVK